MPTVVGKQQGTLTYLQVLEMHGRHGPENPRWRLLINLIAVRPEAQPLNVTLMVAYVSQSPPPPPLLGDMHYAGDTIVFMASSCVGVPGAHGRIVGTGLVNGQVPKRHE